MDMAEYQRLAWRTVPQLSSDDLRTMALFGLTGEVGELVEKVKKQRFHGHVVTTAQLAEELGDILWYVAAATTALGLNLEIVAQANIAKLRQRYPEQFDDELSRER
ncbi:nucleotide pyrophosphohydrolase, partial [Candidatus Woesearchaeota archaeon]